MSPQIIRKLSVGVLGLLVFLFGLILLFFLASMLRPTHTDFIFAISRRTFDVAAGTLIVILAALALLVARGLRRRRLD